MPLTAQQLRTPQSEANIQAQIDWQQAREDFESSIADDSVDITPDYDSIAADVVPTITAATKRLVLLSSTTGTKVILTTTSGANAVRIGQVVPIVLVGASGGQYTLALVSGTLTLNAAVEGAMVMRVATGWICVGLGTATIV